MSDTILVRIADAGHSYLSWRCTHDLDTAHTHPIDAHLVATVHAETAAAAPTPRPGEGIADAIARSLAADERRLARITGVNVLDRDLVVHLRELAVQGIRPRLRIQPSPALAAVAWATVAVPDRWPGRTLTVDDVDPLFDADTRLVDLADVSLLAPVSVVHADERPRRAVHGGAAVYVLDPRLPGQSAYGPLGSVLGRQRDGSPLIRHLAGRLAAETVLPKADNAIELVRRADTDRRRLAELLDGPCSRLVYLGHISAVGDAQTALHLSCADADGGHRPFTAADLVQSGWTMPKRVALLGCASASDLGFAEPFGVLLAAVARGAEVVVATVWVLPTGAALDGAADPLADLTIAVDRALAAEDPVAELCAWQRDRLDRWRRGGGRADSPVFWASALCLDTGETWVR